MSALPTDVLGNSRRLGRVVIASASGDVDVGLIPSQDKLLLMTLKLIFTASLLDAQR